MGATRLLSSRLPSSRLPRVHRLASLLQYDVAAPARGVRRRVRRVLSGRVVAQLWWQCGMHPMICSRYNISFHHHTWGGTQGTAQAKNEVARDTRESLFWW